jgi:hypothetical protein
MTLDQEVPDRSRTIPAPSLRSSSVPASSPPSWASPPSAASLDPLPGARTSLIGAVVVFGGVLGHGQNRLKGSPSHTVLLQLTRSLRTWGPYWPLRRRDPRLVTCSWCEREFDWLGQYHGGWPEPLCDCCAVLDALVSEPGRRARFERIVAPGGRTQETGDRARGERAIVDRDLPHVVDR